jgi:hypothetical protein
MMIISVVEIDTISKWDMWRKAKDKNSSTLGLHILSISAKIE